MSEKSPLVEYQDGLLELLSSGLSQDEILETLKTDPRFESYQDYLDGFDPYMVAVACELMGKWAKPVRDERPYPPTEDAAHS
jgi:ATP-dependent helicase/DNAse subunit B